MMEVKEKLPPSARAIIPLVSTRKCACTQGRRSGSQVAVGEGGYPPYPLVQLQNIVLPVKIASICFVALDPRPHTLRMFHPLSVFTQITPSASPRCIASHSKLSTNLVGLRRGELRTGWSGCTRRFSWLGLDTPQQVKLSDVFSSNTERYPPLGSSLPVQPRIDRDFTKRCITSAGSARTPAAHIQV